MGGEIGDGFAEQHVVELVSDSGEGAQTAGQLFGAVCARMGNGVWTVEIIPAEIEPPHHTVTSTSGNIIRFGTDKVTNWGDQSKLAVAFNDQVLLSRHRLDSLKDDCIILLESCWQNHEDENIRRMYEEAMDEMSTRNYRFVLVPYEEEALKIVDNPNHGKNMFALGILAEIYQRDLSIIEKQIAHIFRFKPQKVTDKNIELVKAGIAWARANLGFQFHVKSVPFDEERIVMNGNQAAALGAIAAGMEMCAMYPITPATEVAEAMSWPGIVGLGEMMNFPGVFMSDDKMHAEMAETMKAARIATTTAAVCHSLLLSVLRSTRHFGRINFVLVVVMTPPP